MFKKIIKNTGYLTISNFIKFFCYALLAIIIAKILGPVYLGLYAFCLTVLELVQTFSWIGDTSFLIREIARDKQKTKDYTGTLLVIRSLSFISIYLLLLLGTMLYSKTPPEIKMIILFFGPIGLFDSIRMTLSAVFPAYENMGPFAITQIVQYLIQLGFGLLFLLIGYGIIGVFIAILIGSFVSFLVTILIFYKLYGMVSFNFLLWKDLISGSFFFWIQKLLRDLVFRTDIIMLYYLLGASAVGFYKPALSLNSLIVVFPSLFIISLYPRFSLLSKHSKKNMIIFYKKSFFYLISLFILVAIPLFLFAKPLIYIIYSEQFFSSIPFLKMLLLPSLFIVLGQNISAYLNSVNKQRIPVIFGLISCSLNIVLNFILIGTYKILGIIISSTISHGLFLVLMIIYVQIHSK